MKRNLRDIRELKQKVIELEGIVKMRVDEICDRAGVTF